MRTVVVKKQMNHSMKHLLFLFACACMAMPRLAFSQDVNEATEPAVKGQGVIDLLAGNTLHAWKLPSAHWHLQGGSIVGETGTGKLTAPEWAYTKQRFGNFEFTCELKLPATIIAIQVFIIGLIQFLSGQV
ncbi:MAG: hypothetical protein WDN26_19150 [Chitinophagaceae bacterium]